MWEQQALDSAKLESFVLEKVSEFAEATCSRQVIAVSNEVGGGGVPDNGVERSFRNFQGLVNQSLTRVVLMVTGLPLTLKDAPQQRLS